MNRNIFYKFFSSKKDKSVLPTISISVDSIEKKSREYAKDIMESDPIEYVEPFIASNALRIGYKRGANEVIEEIEKTISAVPIDTGNYHVIVYHEILHTIEMLKGNGNDNRE